MKRGFLRWFYVAVQFVMLAVSIPKVATLFHAYDPERMGPLIAGIDGRSWLVGIAIDLCAAFTTWAAMAKYDETRKRSALFAPGLIILFCTVLSVIANYEDAATLMPEQYRDVSLFTHPALLINPALISAPPVLVLLLIMLVPSVLARPRLRTSDEITAEADEQVARTIAQARVREAQAQANAKVRGARLKGVIETVNSIANKEEEAVPEPEPPVDGNVSGILQLPPAKYTKAVWNSMSLKERVQESGVITPQEIAEVLGISVSHGRNLAKEAGEKTVAQGRSGVDYILLIDALYRKRTKDSFAYAQKLETSLGIKKKYTRQLHLLTNDPETPEATEPTDEEAEDEA